MLEECSDINSCESLLLDEVKNVDLLGQLPLTNTDFETICNFISKKFSYSSGDDFDIDITYYPATFSCYLVWKGIFNYSEGAYWNSVTEEIKGLNPSKSTMLGRLFLDFIGRNNLYFVEIPRSKKYLTPILMHGIIPQDQVYEYFDKIIYPLVKKELICPTDNIELSYWLKENRKLEKCEENLNLVTEQINIILDEIEKIEDDSSNQTIKYDSSVIQQDIGISEITQHELDQNQDFERDIKKLENLKKRLHNLEKEKLIENIPDDNYSLDNNAYPSENSKDQIYPDSIVAKAGDCLIDYLQEVVERIDYDETEEFLQFLNSFSLAINEKRIILDDESTEKFEELVTYCIDHIQEDTILETPETENISLVIDEENSFLSSDTSELIQNQTSDDFNVELVIELKEEPENYAGPFFTGYEFDITTEMGDYLLAHANAAQLLDNTKNSIWENNNYSIDTGYIRILESLAFYKQEDDFSIKDYTSGSFSDNEIHNNAINTPLKDKTANTVLPQACEIDPSNDVNSISIPLQTESAEKFIQNISSSEKLEESVEKPEINIDLSKIVESLCLQMKKDHEITKSEEKILDKEQNIPDTNPLTTKTIARECDDLVIKKQIQEIDLENSDIKGLNFKSTQIEQIDDFIFTPGKKEYTFIPLEENNGSVKSDQSKTHSTKKLLKKYQNNSSKKDIEIGNLFESTEKEDLFSNDEKITTDIAIESMFEEKTITLNNSDYCKENHYKFEDLSKITEQTCITLEEDLTNNKQKKEFFLIRIISKLLRKK